MEIIDWVSATAIIIIAVLVSGCAGLEIGGKAGIYQVDERTERTEVYSRRRPLACLWNEKYCSNVSEVAYGK